MKEYNITGNNQKLYIDTSSFIQKQGNIANAESMLKLDTSAIDMMENKINGTEVINLLISNWRNTDSSINTFRSFGVKDFDTMLTKQLRSTNNIDQALANSIGVSQATGNYAPFDFIGKFGADQRDIFHNLFRVKKDFPLNIDDPDDYVEFMTNAEKYVDYFVVYDEEKYNYIKNFNCCKYLSKAQIIRKAIKMHEYGCTYVIPVNMIMNAYVGKEREFLERFGFPMVGPDGELNYDLLEILFCYEEDDMVHLDYERGVESYVANAINYYKFYPERYKVQYGRDLYNASGQIDPELENLCLKQAQSMKKAGINEVQFNAAGRLGGTNNTIVNRLSHFLDKYKVMDFEYRELGDHPTQAALQEALDNGETVSFSIHNFVLEDYEGNIISTNGPGTGHQAQLTRIMEDGRYEIASSGRKYYYDPKKHTGPDHYYGFFFAFKCDAPSGPPLHNGHRGTWNIDRGVLDL